MPLCRHTNNSTNTLHPRKEQESLQKQGHTHKDVCQIRIVLSVKLPIVLDSCPTLLLSPAAVICKGNNGRKKNKEVGNVNKNREGTAICNRYRFLLLFFFS